MLAAPRCSFCALAGSAKAPNTKTAALNVSENFLIKASTLMAGLPEKRNPARRVYATFVALSLRRLHPEIAGAVNARSSNCRKFSSIAVHRLCR
jgi:hypothetical protein